MAALESQLIISADDRTAAAFASVQAKLAQLQSTIAAVDRVASPALANAGAFAGPGAALEEHAAAVKAGADQLRAATVPFSSATSSALDSLLKFAGIATGVEVAFEGIRQAFDQEHEKIRMQTAGMTPLEITDAEKLARRHREGISIDPAIGCFGFGTRSRATSPRIPADVITDVERAATAGVNLLKMPGGARDIHADLEADKAGWARLGQEARAFGLSPGDRGELFERYGQGSGLTEEDVMRAPPRHLLDEARRIQISMEADPEAARGAALMAMSSAPDLEAARKSAPAAEAEPDASRKFATSPAIPVSLGPMQGAPQSPNVNVNGSAQVEQTFHIDVSLSQESKPNSIRSAAHLVFQFPSRPRRARWTPTPRRAAESRS
jgi:hypothetical protein